VLSGFVNPERGMLRSRAMEMGAQYQPDWNSDCTLLVCAFPNTPKFRQVEADCGTIVSKVFLFSLFLLFKRECQYYLSLSLSLSLSLYLFKIMFMFSSMLF